MSDVFTLDMTVADAMTIHPRVQEVFASFHLGGCSHCAISNDETVGQVTSYYGVDPEMLFEALDSLLESEGITPEDVAAARAKASADTPADS